MPARPRETCTACSLRRQKCDRQLPCGRCVKRGVPEQCSRQWPDDKYDPSVHRVYPRSRPKKRNKSARGRRPSTDEPHASTSTPLSAASASDSGLLQGIEAHAAAAAAEEGDPEVGCLGIPLWANNGEPRLNYTFTPYRHKRLRRLSAQQNGPPVGPWASTTNLGFNSTADAQETFLQMLFPRTDHIWKLVDYHELYLLWYHGCYHGPTLRWELHRMLAEQDPSSTLNIKGLDLQWLALLFAVMAGSLTCATARKLEQWGFSKREAVKLSTQWYKATITCLGLAEYTSNHSIHSVHAIATLTMSAHPLGRSSELSVLLGAALKVAQSLGLDRLCLDPTLEQITPSSPESQRHDLLQREIGRRLWSQLCVQDWMSLPFAESHCIHPLHFTTTKPSSRNHLTMDPIPATFPTYISYGNYLFEIAGLMVSHHEAMLHAQTAFTQYEQVLDFDLRMRNLATQGMPRYFHVVEPVDPAWPEWVPWARRSLTICFAHKIIMIHRQFLRQSFLNPAYSITRMTCVAAAKTILNEAKQLEDGPIIWVDKAFCVAAGVVLCLDMFHRPSNPPGLDSADPDYQTHRQLVVECIGLLAKFDASVVAVRGAGLLSALVAERDRQPANPTWPPQNIDTADILQSLAAATTTTHQSGDAQSTTTADHMTTLPELFPPQAGFCNRFLFEVLLGFDKQ